MSSRAGKRLPTAKPYLLPYNRMGIAAISDTSYFEDDVLVFRTDVPGRSATQSVNWRLGVPDWLWNKDQFQSTIKFIKRFLLCLIHEGNLRPTTLIGLGQSFRNFAVWMNAEGYRKLSDINHQACQEWLEYVCAQYVDDESSLDDIPSLRVVEQTIQKHLGVISKLVQFRQQFDSMPEMQVSPTVVRWASSLGSWSVSGAKELERIPSVPEELFNPTLVAATCWMDNYSIDVRRLQEIEDRAYAHCRYWRSRNYADYVNRRLTTFRFSIFGSSDQPWRTAIASQQDFVSLSEGGAETVRKGPIWVLRRLISTTVAACSIVVQAFVGMRASELLGLEVYPQRSDGWPACLEARPSQDGMYEVFYVKGPITKGKKNGQTLVEEWVAGIRPVGTDVLPEAVRAILVLTEMLKNWRDLGNLSCLFVHAASCGGGMPRAQNSAVRMSWKSLVKYQNAFLLDQVEVPEKYVGWHITTHQWRKKFAQDIVRCDSKAIPAVRDHFKQMSSWVLETAYLGHDLTLLEAVNSVALRDAASEIVDMLDEEMPFAGRAPEIIRNEAVELRRVINLATTRNDKIDATIKILEDEGVRAWECEFGTCMFRCETAKCHFMAKGEFDHSAVRPLASERRADLCGSCANLSVSIRYRDFWRHRFHENIQIWRANGKAGHVSLALIAAQRTKMAKGVLLALGENLGEYADAI